MQMGLQAQIALHFTKALARCIVPATRLNLCWRRVVRDGRVHLRAPGVRARGDRARVCSPRDAERREGPDGVVVDERVGGFHCPRHEVELSSDVRAGVLLEGRVHPLAYRVGRGLQCGDGVG